MMDLRSMQGVQLGQWCGQLPNRPRSYMISDATAEKIREALDAGFSVVVGNYPSRRGIRLSQVNSRYHGRSIRTIHAIIPQ